MKTVICDTNIWYDLGEGIISFNQSDEYELCCTHLSLYELIHTERLKEDHIKVSLACKAVLAYSKRFIQEPPLVYLTNLLQPVDKKISNSNFLGAIEYLASGQLLDEDVMNELDKHIASYKNTLQKSFISPLFDEIGVMRTIFAENKSIILKYKEGIKREDKWKRRIEVLKSKIIKEISPAYPISETNFNEAFWKKIQFYMRSRIAYSEKLKLDKTMKPEPNDAVDLVNLIYVDADSLYWTNDKRWKNIIKEAMLGNYLFNNVDLQPKP